MPNRILDTVKGMARFFSMFPAGSPGFGLLLLRASIAAISLIHLRQNTSSGIISVIPVLALFLCLGLFTPLSSVLYVVVESLLFFANPAEPVVFILLALNSAVLALLGPGVYSVDARLFGRRVIDLPKSKNNRSN